MQVVSRKLRIGILPATVPRVTDARAHAVPRVGTHSMGRASGSVSQRNEAQGRLSFDTYAPPSLRGYVRIPVVLTSLKPEAARKSIPDPDRSQPKTSRRSFLLRQVECGEIILHVECRDRRWRHYRRVGDEGRCPLAHRSALPTSVMVLGCPLPTTPAVPRRLRR